jgi:hypothetical protein
MGQLQCRPVQRTGRPCYPTKLQILDHPELLARHVPPAWLAKAEVAGALSAFLAVNTVGCAGKPAAIVVGVDPRLATAAIVAPIFEHGEGGGRRVIPVSAGSWPVFLSEDDALQIIQEELGKYGLDVFQRNMVLDSVIIEARAPEEKCDWLTERRIKGAVFVKEPLELDLVDPQRHVAVEYVSEDDLTILEDENFSPTVKQVAEHVRSSVGQHAGGVYFGTFYDPSPKVDLRGLLSGEAIAESKEMLRAQVKDFADWLKGQGVI